MSEFPVTTICGSMRFFDEMLETAHRLTGDGFIVLMPLVHVIGVEEQKTSEVKKMLDRMHFAKIDMSESIHVVGGGRYVGESTSKEIQYAMDHDKNIVMLP